MNSNLQTRKRLAAKKRRRSGTAPITTTAAGVVTYRTRQPLSEKRAVAFAKFLACNPRFLDATIVRSRKENHFHVCYLPASIARIERMLDLENAKDRKAAERDGRYFLYSEIRPGVYECVGLTGVYEVSLVGSGSCGCPHFQYRRRSPGGACKHMIELARRAEAGLLDA